MQHRPQIEPASFGSRNTEIAADKISRHSQDVLGLRVPSRLGVPLNRSTARCLRQEGAFSDKLAANRIKL
jgi:hypothetical protein